MLSGDFFYITNLHQESGKIGAMLEINAGHQIFKGHFPGQPVVPGVCMMQMVKEILEAALVRSTRLISADQLKFLTVIDPTENKSVQAIIKYSNEEDGSLKVAASLVNGPVTYFKMNAVFVLSELPVEPGFS